MAETKLFGILVGVQDGNYRLLPPVEGNEAAAEEVNGPTWPYEPGFAVVADPPEEPGNKNVNPNKVRFIGHYLGLCLFLIDLPDTFTNMSNEAQRTLIHPIIRPYINPNALPEGDIPHFQWLAFGIDEIVELSGDGPISTTVRPFIQNMVGAAGGSTVMGP